MTRPLRFALLAALAFALAACTAPAPQADAGTPPEASSGTPAEEPAATPAPAAQGARPAKPPRMSDPLPPRRVPDQAVVIDSSCKTDADCAVKDVGNCCGYYPACVNKDSPTDPQGVKAQCAKSGMASVCGFREISACTCSAGKCQAAADGAAVAQ